MIIVHLTTSPFFGGPERLMLGLTQSLPASCRSVFVLFADQGKARHFGGGSWTRDWRRSRWPTTRPSSRHGARADGPAPGMGCRRPLLPRLQGRHRRPAGGAACGRARDRHVARLDRRDLEGADLRGPRSGLPAEDGSGGLRLGGSGREGPPGRGAGRSRGRHPQRGPGRTIRSRRSRRTAAYWRRCFPRPRSGSSARPGGSAPKRGSASWSRPRRSWPDPIRVPGSSTSAMARSASRSAGGSGSSGWKGGSSWPASRRPRPFPPHWDLSVLPSFTEGLPTVVLESYAAGVPVVATAVGGTPEAVADGVDGYLVPPGDPTALARRILDLLKSENQRIAMGQRGRERICSEFSFDTQATTPAGGVRRAGELPGRRRCCR